MPPKKKKQSKRPKKEPIPDIDLASDEHFKPLEPIVYVEMDKNCFVFKEQLDNFEQLMQAKFPQTKFHFLINTKHLVGEQGPRNGSFEIWFAQNARCKEELLWTGIDKGPPRRLKFSKNDYLDLWPNIKKILTRFYQLDEMGSNEEVDNE